ncbi:hypothetical protein ACVWWQ_000270 [Rhodanobacter sp. TND4EL1]
MTRTFRTPKKGAPLICAAEQASAHILTIAAIDAARAQLARYSLATVWPALGMVGASDLLDAAYAALAEGGRHAAA